jgi:hypothetical protein
LGHEAGNEGNVTREAVELSDNHAALELSCISESGCQLWSPVECSSAFTCFSFDVLADDGHAFGFCEPSHTGTLSVYSKARALLSPCGDTIIGDSDFHTNSIPPFAICMKSEALQQSTEYLLEQQRTGELLIVAARKMPTKPHIKPWMR